MTGESDLPQDLATRADDLLHTRPNAGQLAALANQPSGVLLQLDPELPGRAGVPRSAILELYELRS